MQKEIKKWMGPLHGTPPSSLSETLTLRADTDTASPIQILF